MTSPEKTINYKVVHDEHWQELDRVGERSRDAASLATLITDTCGYGSALDIYCEKGLLVKELLDRGLDAFGVDSSSMFVEFGNSRCAGRFNLGSILTIPFPNASFDVVISTNCAEHVAPADVPAALRELYRVSSHYVFLRIATTRDREGLSPLTVEGRAWWEARCFEAGFRKHALYYRANPYEALNRDESQILILLEKVPVAALASYDLSVLVEERLLHTDMLREVGRRSDAHCIRYHKAAEFVRPGDRVLDVACGLGYGSHILYAASQARSVLGVDLSEFGIAYANAHYGRPGAIEFAVGDAQMLQFVPDHSIDFIAAFETIEHVPDPLAYLRELKRVLKPSGRIMVCAPNNWADETGKDPNPHHLHVYTWERLVDECGRFFLLEHGFLQTAGGAARCHHAPRKWIAITPEQVPQEDSEWILLLGMSDPVAGRDVPYNETAWALPDSPEFHVSAFARDYMNPWLVKGMVAMGMRIRSASQLATLQERVLAAADPASVDYGAALCGRIYLRLQEGELKAGEVNELEKQIGHYAAISNPSPHQIRWQVSLLFAGGELARQQGRFADAAAFFSDCVSRDVAVYSPLLGNKVIDALYWLAVLALDVHDKKAARAHLLQSVERVRQLVSGSWLNVIGDHETPLPFGLAELAQLLDKASRAAYMLSVLDGDEIRQGVVYQESAGFFERQLVDRDRRLNELTKAIDGLQEVSAEKDSRAQELGQEVIRLDVHAQALAREVGARDADAQQLARQVAEKEARAQELGREVIRLDAHAQALAREVGARDADAQQFAQLVAEKDARVQELAQEVIRLDAHAQALAREVGARDADAQQLARDLIHARAEIGILRETIEKQDAILVYFRPHLWLKSLRRIFRKVDHE